MKTKSIISAVAGLLLLAVQGVQAQGQPVLVTADELGNGTIQFGTQPATPMPGELTPSGLFYNMLNPPSLVTGDVLLLEWPGGPISDVIRFTAVPGQPFGFFFFSDNSDGVDEPADIVGLPATLEANQASLVEGLLYTPTPNQPGFVADFTVSYRFGSDVERVPEGGFTLSFLVFGVAAIAAARRRLSL